MTGCVHVNRDERLTAERDFLMAGQRKGLVMEVFEHFDAALTVAKHLARVYQHEYAVVIARCGTTWTVRLLDLAEPVESWAEVVWS